MYRGTLHGHLDAASIARKLSSLRAFFRFLVRRGVREDNPAWHLYQRHGFEITETVVNRVGGRSLVMHYTFPAPS